jgi:hypothetical protein
VRAPWRAFSHRSYSSAGGSSKRVAESSKFHQRPEFRVWLAGLVLDSWWRENQELEPFRQDVLCLIAAVGSEVADGALLPVSGPAAAVDKRTLHGRRDA